MKLQRLLSGLAILAGLALPSAAIAQHPYQGLMVQANGPWAAGTLARSDAARAADVINLRDMGAICDGNSHPLSVSFATLAAAQAAYPLAGITALTEETDTAAINNAIAKAASTTANTANLDAGYLVKWIGRITAGTGTCQVNAPINLTVIKSRALDFDFNGSALHCFGAGLTCIDMTGALGMHLDGLTLFGDQTTPPKIGILSGRYSTQYGSTYNTLNHVTADGTFTFADYVNIAAEDNTVVDGDFSNSAANAYAMVLDGQNYWNNCSSISGVACIAQYTAASFNSFNCYACKLLVNGANSSPLWMSRTSGDRFIGGYFHAFGSGKPPAVVMDFSHSSPNRFDQFDAHMEDGDLGAVFRLQGAASILLDNVTLKDHAPQITQSVFQADTAGTYGPAVTAVTINNLDAQMGSLPSGTTWWDSPTIYSVSGRIWATDNGGWSPPSGNNITTCFGQTCSITQQQIPSVISTGEIVNAGSITGVALTYRGVFSRTASVPTCTIAPPPPPSINGASCHVATFQINASGSPLAGSAGTGYDAKGDIVQDTTDTCTVPPTFNVFATGGVPTRVVVVNRGICSAYSTAPINTTALTGSGSGLVITGSNFGAQAVVVDNAGSGYTVPPSVHFSGNSNTAPQGIAYTSGNLTVSAGGATLNFSSAGLSATGPISWGNGDPAGLSQIVSTTYTVGNAYTAGSLLLNGSNLYQVSNLGCTAANATGPTATTGTQNLDGCAYTFVQAGATYPELAETDQGITFPQGIGLGVIGNPGATVQEYSTQGSPNGVVTAPVGSLDVDAANGNLWVNQDGNTNWAEALLGSNLPAATTGTLGGILATNCGTGSYITAIASGTGVATCGTPSTGGGGGSTTVAAGTGTSVNTAGSTATVSVLYGTTAGTAAQGNDPRFAAAEQTANKDAAGGYAGLTSGGLLKAAELPAATASAFGGVESITCAAGSFVSGLTSGTGGFVCGSPSTVASADTVLAAGTTTPLALSQLLYDSVYYDMRWFGAALNGCGTSPTDDQGAVTAAVNQVAADWTASAQIDVIYVPGCLYTSKGFNFPAGVPAHVIGNGPDNSRIIWATTAKTGTNFSGDTISFSGVFGGSYVLPSDSTITSYSSYVSGASVKDITIVGNTTLPGNGIMAYDSNDHIYIQHNLIQFVPGCAICVGLTKNTGVGVTREGYIEDNRLEVVGGSAIAQTGTNAPGIGIFSTCSSCSTGSASNALTVARNRIFAFGADGIATCNQNLNQGIHKLFINENQVEGLSTGTSTGDDLHIDSPSCPGVASYDLHLDSDTLDVPSPGHAALHLDGNSSETTSGAQPYAISASGLLIEKGGITGTTQTGIQLDYAGRAVSIQTDFVNVAGSALACSSTMLGTVTLNPGSDYSTWTKSLNCGTAKLDIVALENGTFTAGHVVVANANGLLTDGGVAPQPSLAAGSGLQASTVGNVETVTPVYGTSAATVAQGNDPRFAAAEQTANKDQPNGYAGLTSGTLLNAAEIPFATASAPGGVEASTCSAGQFVSGVVSGNGQLACTTPATVPGSATTYNPTITPQTLGDWSVSYATQSGRYFTIGPYTCASVNITWTGTWTTASGTLQISLPTTANASVTAGAPPTVFNNAAQTYAWPGSATMLLLVPQPSKAYSFLQFYKTGIGSPSASLTIANTVSGTAYTVAGTVCYF